jgi:hypothetical protein
VASITPLKLVQGGRVIIKHGGIMEIIGQIVKIQTTADMCVRIVIDADKDAVPADVFTALNHMALLKIDKEDK